MATSAGRINKLFGTDGGLMLSLYPTFPADFTSDQPLFVTIDALEVPIWCERFERRGITGAVASFADFDTERRAQELIGLEFRIGNPVEEEESDEFYLEDLIGFAVKAAEIDKTTTYNGRIADYYDSEVNPLFGVEIDGHEVLVPAAEEFITHIDFKKRTIKLLLPEGLIGLK